MLENLDFKKQSKCPPRRVSGSDIEILYDHDDINSVSWSIA